MKFLTHFFVFCILFTFTAQFQVVKIGVIFFHDELDMMAAFDAALHDINSRELDVRLEAVKHFISLDDSLTLQELTCDLIENGVAAIFGPTSKASSDIVEVICNSTGIPHLQFDWHIREVDLHRRNHQLTVNVAPAEFWLSTAYWDILRNKDFDWKSFTIVYETSRDLSRMQHLLAWKQLHKNGIKLWKFKRGDDYRVLWKLINNAREKNVLLDCTSDILAEVVNASIYFNMTGQFNNWFFTNLDTHLSKIDALYSKDFTASTIAVRVRPYMPPPLHDEADIFEDEPEDKIVTIHAQLIYDAVVLYYNALRNIIHILRFYKPQLRCGHSFWRPGPEILNEMKKLNSRNVTPPFKTQKMSLNFYGERDDFNLEIYNPMIDRISHVWNKNQQLVTFEEISEARRLKKLKYEEKEDFSQKRVTYTVATRIGEPYVMWREEPEGVHYEGNERFEGYAVDLIYKLAEECKFDFRFEPVPDNMYGAYDPVTDEWNGIIRQLIDNNAQIGICDLTITQARRSVVDFTVPFMQLGVSILHYKEPPPPKNLYGFLKPYSLEVWVYLIVALVLTALVLVVNSRISQDEWVPEMPHITTSNELVNEWHFTNTLWLYIGSILNQGCDLLPRGTATRYFTAFWWIFALLLSQTYIAKLASFITSAKLEGSIRDLHDLIDQNKIKFGTVKGGSTSLLFSESNESEYRVAWNKMITMKPDAFTANNKEGVDRVKRSRGLYAFLMETTNLQYYLERSCELKQVGEPFGEKLYGIAVPLNAPFRSNLSVGILKLSEKGVLYTLKNKWFNSNKTCEDGGIPGAVDDNKFTMESLGGLFIVLLVGIAIAIVIGICEFLWNVEQIAVKERISTSVALKAELKFFLCFWLSRKPLRTYQRSQSTTSTGYSSLHRAPSAVGGVKKKKKSKRKKSN